MRFRYGQPIGRVVEGPALQILEQSIEGRELNTCDAVANVSRHLMQVIVDLDLDGAHDTCTVQRRDAGCMRELMVPFRNERGVILHSHGQCPHRFHERVGTTNALI